MEAAVAYVDINAPLVERCRLNDRQAQAEIYRRYAKAMFNAALRITGDYAEAEDVLQESFLSAFRELSSYKGDSAFGAWLKRIVVNKSINDVKFSDTIQDLNKSFPQLDQLSSVYPSTSMEICLALVYKDVILFARQATDYFTRISG